MTDLSRPLGWTKPKAPVAFRLITTAIKADGKHKALIRNTGSVERASGADENQRADNEVE